MAKKIKVEKEISNKKLERKLAIDKYFVKRRNTWSEWWKNHNLFKKILFTLFIIALFLAAGTITLPGVDLAHTDKLNQGDFFGILNLVGGGGLRRFSIVALGIGPFISSSLVMMILQTKIFPPIYRLSQSGPIGRIKINFITYSVTLFFAIFQAILITRALLNPTDNFGIRFSPNIAKTMGETGALFYEWFIIPLLLVAGSFFSLFLSEQITNKGVGNGTSLIIFVGIASSLIPTFRQAFEYYMPSVKNNNAIILKETLNFVVYLLAYLLVIFIVTFFSLAERRIPIQQVGAGLSKTEKELSYLPIKANPAGIMSVIFSMMILSLPTMIASLFNPDTSRYYQWVYANLQLTQPLGFFLFVIITFGLTILMGIQQSKIDKISEDFAKSSTFIPGIRPGEQTETYLLNVVLRLSFFSAGYLIILGALQFIQQMFGMPAPISFGGTTIMILVSTAIETVQQIQARYKSQELARKRRMIKELKEVYGEEENLIW
ncbi:preprotein translocase subunit SecY [Metamycoplasma alkalescens]|uniref:Protein translocase subunit SecY n=2 Tax=Metamycoplasma alkalescens TaxID=45363 RepID=A0A318UJ54_9BACT|nr:preprotein translocase subunit SecY [Metamycoplasma alkalescens]PYF43034.1 preprotein translocase subunit SecY [Metamycoplasma alkalescens]